MIGKARLLLRSIILRPHHDEGDEGDERKARERARHIPQHVGRGLRDFTGIHSTGEKTLLRPPFATNVGRVWVILEALDDLYPAAAFSFSRYLNHRP